MTPLPDRRHPVHVAPVERHNAPVILHATICIRPRSPALASTRFQTAFRRATEDANAWTVGYYLIMPDHIHLFCRPAILPRVSIKRWASYLKRRSSIHYGHHQWTWQPDCWDTQMRDQNHYLEKRAYVRMNPVREGLVDRPEDWPYQGEPVAMMW